MVLAVRTTRRAAALAAPVLALATGLAALPAAAAGAASSGQAPAQARVVVLGAPGGSAQVQAAVARLGGTVTRGLPLVDGVAATVPARAVGALAAAPGVAQVTPDAPVVVQGGPAAAAAEAALPGEPERPLPSSVVRAREAWAAGITGRGVTVAVLDTGISPTPDLAGRIVPVRRTLGTAPCYDLSGEGTCRDTFGHGTFMAGLIAGDGRPTGGQVTGTAPGASLVSVKVAGRTGAADVSTVLAGIQWVVSFKDTYGIDVLNLSLGTNSTNSWKTDPLNYAVQRAWESGITVVVAGSNNGPARGSVSKPGDDPYVITVGATDSLGTEALGDDRVPDFSSRGPTREGIGKPDVVAPGARVLSLQAEGSTIATRYPSPTPGAYRRGSGTSMATAVVSGAVALALQANPGMSPDRVKHALRTSARKVATTDRTVVGAGMVDAYATALRPADGTANVGLARSTGYGELGRSRGSLKMEVQGLLPTLLTARQTAQLALWEPGRYVKTDWTPWTWYTSLHGAAGWNTVAWADAEGHDWVGHDWVGHDWVGSSWQGQQEQGTDYGRTGPGSASYGAWR